MTIMADILHQTTTDPVRMWSKCDIQFLRSPRLDCICAMALLHTELFLEWFPENQTFPAIH